MHRDAADHSEADFIATELSADRSDVVAGRCGDGSALIDDRIGADGVAGGIDHLEGSSYGCPSGGLFSRPQTMGEGASSVRTADEGAGGAPLTPSTLSETGPVTAP